ncbi:MAG: alcohol dehydrogenase catalytic domain-containing protein [bacterium]|nr:alcohol dehydrogenase catalytic domain-containing protein [bacterium]
MDTMRQLVLTQPGTLELREVARPTPKPGEALIRIHHCGICGTDTMFYRGETIWGRDAYPKYPGHELSGTVTALGKGVDALAVGDRVVAECTIGCGDCAYCKAGHYSVCQHRLSFSNGAMADYVSVPAKAVHPLPESVSLLHGALIEPVAVGCVAARKCGPVFGRTVGVIGGGTIGLGALMTLNLSGAAKSCLIELRADRLAAARDVGATLAIDARTEDTAAAVRAFTDGVGLDAIVVATAGTANTVPLALELAAPLATVSVVGLSGGQRSAIDADDLSEKETVLVGSHSSPGVWEDLIASVAAGRYDLAPLVSHTIPLDRAEDAFALLEDADQPSRKVVVTMEDE